ncbi:MAG: SAM-dependent methyltransferase [Candidatus Woesearchaeota archaeon]
MFLISVYQAEQLLKDLETNKEESLISLDLGLSNSVVKIDRKESKFIFPDEQVLGLEKIKKIIKKDTICFYIKNNDIFPVSIFSEETNNYYKLVPTGLCNWPTLEISGIRMHVTKKYGPKEDTEEKISFIAPCVGAVLDTCTGLGYTAIMAAKTANLVFTIERDKNVIEIEKINPYSKELFTNEKIKRIIGDSFEEIKKFKACYFDRIIHDPPRVALSPLLYSQEFYNELFRVLKYKGKIFHYTGDPGSKKGLDIRAGIIKRFEKAGFKNIKRVFNGISAEKI